MSHGPKSPYPTTAYALASHRAERLHEKDCLLSDRYLKTPPRYPGSFQGTGTRQPDASR